MTETGSTVTSLVVEAVAASCEARPGTRLYLFGSCLGGSVVANDVDVLLVYADGDLDSAHVLAELLRDIREPSSSTCSH